MKLSIIIQISQALGRPILYLVVFLLQSSIKTIPPTKKILTASIRQVKTDATNIYSSINPTVSSIYKVSIKAIPLIKGQILKNISASLRQVKLDYQTILRQNLILRKKITNTIIQIYKPLQSIKLPRIQIKLQTEKTQSLNTKHTPRNRYKILGTITAILIITPLITATFLYYHFKLYETPSINNLSNYQTNITTKIYDRNNTLLYEIYEDQNRSLTKIEELPAHVIQAHIAIEDEHFYEHRGISITAIARAARYNLNNLDCEWKKLTCTPTSFQGASTITQQLIKNTLLTSERSWERKIKEAIIAIQIERNYTKEQILEMYLNQIPYGGTAYGIEAASQTYFNKSAKELTLSEAALLAGLPQAPSIYSPFGTNPQAATNRHHQVLNQMANNGYITYEQALQAKQQTLTYASPNTDIKAPHFVMYLKEMLEQKLGTNQIYHGGLNIKTTLDLNVQKLAEETLSQELDQLNRLNVTNGAILVLKPQTGEILAMVGSSDYFNTENHGNYNATTALRQPGSSIKPLTYATALSLSIPSPFTQIPRQTYTAASIIDDSPITFKIPGSADYTPKNYDGKFHGHVTVRTALASSYNIPAVKTLNDIGIRQLIDMGKKLGITTWDQPERYGLSLTLGGGEIRMTELATVYATFANLGKTQPLNPILNITDIHNKNPFNQAPPSPFDHEKPNLDPKVAFIINDILSDPEARIPAFGRFSKLNIPNASVAVKTGTTNGLRDNWTIGYTPNYLVAVWVGNFDNTPMSRIASGITGATPIWNKVMTYLLTEYEPGSQPANTFPWETPPGMVQVPICKYTGTLPCAGCPTKTEWFIKGTEPLRHCSSSQFTQPQPTP